MKNHLLVQCVATMLVTGGGYGVNTAFGQAITFDTARDVAVPDHATLRIGPFYSTVGLTVSGGYRYTTSSGRGTDFLEDNRRGRIRSDGSDFPIRTSLDFRNYLIVTRNMDLDVSVRLSYLYFPLDTQENEFRISMPDDGLEANLSTQFRLTPYVVGRLTERFRWETDFVDERGLSDDNAGRRYEFYDNLLGASLTWSMAQDKNLIGSVSRRDVISLEDEFDDQERVVYSESLTYEHQVFEGVVFGGKIVFRQTDFEDEARSDTDQEDFQLFARASGVKGGRMPITERTVLTLGIGASSGAQASTGDRDLEDRGRRRRNSEITRLNANASIETQMTKRFSHKITYDRGLRTGFNSSFEEYDRLGYEIDYKREGVGIRVFTNYDKVEPTDDENGYSVWNAGIGVNYPIYDFLSLDAEWVYRLRDNERFDEDVNTDDRDPDTVEDYFDRRLRLGTSLQILKQVKGEVFYERFERLSDFDNLEFTRDTFETRFTYSRVF